MPWGKSHRILLSTAVKVSKAGKCLMCTPPQGWTRPDTMSLQNPLQPLWPSHLFCPPRLEKKKQVGAGFIGTHSKSYVQAHTAQSFKSCFYNYFFIFFFKWERECCKEWRLQEIKLKRQKSSSCALTLNTGKSFYSHNRIQEWKTRGQFRRILKRSFFKNSTFYQFCTQITHNVLNKWKRNKNECRDKWYKW